MRTRKNISARAGLTRIAGTTAALAALLLLAACQNELPIQRPGGDCGMDPQPACVTISVGTKPAEEKTVAYGITTPATDAGTQTDDATRADAIRADATTRTDLTGKWQVGDQIVVSLQYYSDTEGTNPENLLRTDEQTLTYNYNETETAPEENRPRYWTPDPELLPLPQGVRSIRVTYRYRGAAAMTNEMETGSTSGDATIVEDKYNDTHTLVLGNELMTGHLEASNDPTARAGIASITPPTDADAMLDGCTSLVVISDPTAAIELPAPQWHRFTAQVRLTGMTPGQMVHLERGTMMNNDDEGSSYILAGGISLTAPDAPDASPDVPANNVTPATYNARIYFQPEALADADRKNVLTLYDVALSGSPNSLTPPRYFRLDCQPDHCYSFLATALNLSSAGTDAQPVDGTDKDACLALLTRDNPHWIVTGGGGDTGSGKTDADVLTNVRAALDAMKDGSDNVPDTDKGTIDLVLTGVTSLPTQGNSDGAFEGYTQLRSISAPEVTSIGNYAFYHCSALTTVSLPKAEGDIKKYAFNGCSDLATISLPAITGSIGESAFYGCSTLTIANLPGVTGGIGVSAFNGCSALTTISLPEAKGSIEGYAFYGCSALATANLPKVIGSIEEYAFKGCSALTAISLPEAKGGIGVSAFKDCSALTTANLPEAKGSIEGYAFYGCSALTTINLPKVTGSIGAVAFYNCSVLTAISLPEINDIGYHAFYKCQSLKTLCLTKSGSFTMHADAFEGFDHTACTLYLNSDKWSDSSGEISPLVVTNDEGKSTWPTQAEPAWKEIIPVSADLKSVPADLKSAGTEG